MQKTSDSIQPSCLGTTFDESHGIFAPKEYLRPVSVAEALQLMGKYGERGRVIAGGTDLLLETNENIEALIDLAGLNLNGIKRENGKFHLGATVPYGDLLSFKPLAEQPYTALVQAAGEVGTPQIQNRATIGGNLCSAVSCADGLPALLALDAQLVAEGAGGERVIPISEFFLGVRQQCLSRDELLKEISLPTFQPRTASWFLKKGRVTGSDLALVNVAVRITLSDAGCCQDVRIALGAVAPTPVRIERAERLLEAQPASLKIFEKAADIVADEIRPIDDVRCSADYRRSLSRVLVIRALEQAVKSLSS